MTFENFIKEIDEIKTSFDIGRLYKLDDIKDLKFNLDEKIKDKNLCFKFSSFNIILFNEIKKMIKFDEEVVKENLVNCDIAYFILDVKLKNNFNHVTSLIIDHKKRRLYYLIMEIMNLLKKHQNTS